MPAGGRRWFVFGDMLELGTYAREEHAAVGSVAAGAVDELVLVGTDVRATAEAAIQAGMPASQIHLFSASLADAAALASARRQAAAAVRASLRAGDLVLVKGSLGVGMDAIVAVLQERDEDGCEASHAAAGGDAHAHEPARQTDHTATRRVR